MFNRLGDIFKSKSPTPDTRYDAYQSFQPQATSGQYNDPFNASSGYGTRNYVVPQSGFADNQPLLVDYRSQTPRYRPPAYEPEPQKTSEAPWAHRGLPISAKRPEPISRSQAATAPAQVFRSDTKYSVPSVPPVPSYLREVPPAPSYRREVSKPYNPYVPPVRPAPVNFREVPKHPPNEIHFYNKEDRFYGFSNFAEYPVFYENEEYRTAEHLFQSLKFLDKRDADRVRRCRTAREAAKVAQTMQNRARKDWIVKRINVSVMEKVLICKFSQHEELANLLLSTGNAKIFQDSPTDEFWGTGQEGNGQNKLGVLLMETRAILRDLTML